MPDKIAPTTAASAQPTRTQILRAVLGASVAASLLLVAVVLPAEFGVDPTGFGRLTGLNSMAPFQATAVASFHDQEFRSDTIDIALKAYEELEYKLQMEAGATLVYAWSVVEKLPVYVDFHGETTDAPELRVLSYRVDEQTVSSNGALVAPFAGIHGWFWQNNKTPVIVRLRTSGFYRLVDTSPKN